MPNLSPEQAEFLRKEVFTVDSASSPGTFYVVARTPAWFCNCPGFKFHKGHYPENNVTPTCRHIKSIEARLAELRALDQV